MVSFTRLASPLVLLLVASCLSVDPQPCIRRHYKDPKATGLKSFVCVCNSTHCDQVGPTVYPKSANEYTVYGTSMKGLRLARRTGKMVKNGSKTELNIKIDTSKKFQSIIGFGGAFTDSAAINFKKLGDDDLKAKLIKAYYSDEGIEYNMGRIPMASCDFSTHEYSYDNVSNDFDLTNFNLAPEDIFGKIPMINFAQSVSKRDILFFGSPWSAPAWMKTNGRMAAGGSLKGEPGGKYFKTWAQYFVKFIREYRKHKITIWGVTSQNEPTNIGLTTKFQQMHYNACTMRDFIKTDLGPALNASGLSDVKLMIIDDQRLFLPYWSSVILSDPNAKKYVSGIAVHWYLDGFIPDSVLSNVQHDHPDTFILPTEACQGSRPWDSEKVSLGSWSRAQSYAQDIIRDLNNYAVGWIDWNLDLDTQGGPNWVSNFVDSPIIVNVTADGAEFLKQPMYYALGHFSKFVPRGSVRVQSTVTGAGNVEGVAFVTKDNYKVLVLLNSNDGMVEIGVDTYPGLSARIEDVMPPRSIQTYIWK